MKLILPESTESICCKLGIAAGVLDVPVAQIMLKRPCIVAVDRQLEAASVAQHVGMDGERQSGLSTGSGDQLSHSGIR